MIAVGSNELVFCPLALMKIVERHLNESQPVKEGAIRVTSVTSDDAGLKFSVTSDPPPK